MACLDITRELEPRNPKTGRMEAHHTDIQRTYLEVKRSKVKVTRPINAHTVNVQYLPNEKAYERQIGTQTQHEDRHQRQAP